MSIVKLSRRKKLGFGIADLGGNLFFTAMGFWTLNYLTDTVALSAAAAGFAIMIGKLWDAVTDPMMGYISDRTKTKMGRRRPYILFGSIPLGLCMWYFFTNPHIQNQTSLTLWAVLALCALNTAYTVVNIPYSSLTPELTQDYHEQTSLNSYRFGSAVIGTITGAAIVLPIVNAFPTKTQGFSRAGLIMGLIMTITALITFFSVKEPPINKDSVPKDGFFKTYSVVFSNKPYIILIITYAMNIIALNFLQGILVYYFKYVFNAEESTTLAMVMLLLVSMVFIPISVPLSKKIGKRLTYQIGLGTIAVGSLLISIFGQKFGINFVYAMMIVNGIGVGLAFVAPWAMVPDAIEWDAYKTGIRREGVYYGMWTFFSKCGQAISIAITGLILSSSGYVADAIQSLTTINAIRLIVGPIPFVIFGIGVYVISRYPITEAFYKDMKQANEARKEN